MGTDGVKVGWDISFDKNALSSTDIGLWTELWLVTEFVANGSLFDYLSRCSIDVPGICHMASGIAGGLAHLHMEIQGLQVRPPDTPYTYMRKHNAVY